MGIGERTYARFKAVLMPLLNSGALITQNSCDDMNYSNSLTYFACQHANTKKKLFTGTVSNKNKYYAKIRGLDERYTEFLIVMRPRKDMVRSVISLPLKSSDGKTLIDVMNSQKGIFELQEYTFAQEARKQKQAEWNEKKEAEGADNTVSFFKEDSDSFDTVKSTNSGKKSDTTGVRVSLGKGENNKGPRTIKIYR